MNKYYSILILSLFCLNVTAQKNTVEGPKLLFKNVKSSLTAGERTLVYKKTGFGLSKDGKQFVIDGDPSALDYPFDAVVYPTDLNKDGVEEIFIVFGNSYTSGMAGSNVLLLIKDKAGVYQSNFGFSGTAPDIIPNKNKGYPDLIIGGPGFEFPVWRWNGKEYEFFRKIAEKELLKMKATNVAEASKTYVTTIKQ